MAPPVLASPVVLNRIRTHVNEFPDTSSAAPPPIFRKPANLGNTNRLRQRSWKNSAGLASAVSAVVLVASFESWRALPSGSVAAASHPIETPRTLKIDGPAKSKAASVVLPATICP